MKTHHIAAIRIAIVACTAAGAVALAQGSGGPGRRGGPPGQGGPGPNGGPPPPPPVIQALDTNHDGIIEANEIANAPAALRTLEKSGSDQLTIPDLLGPPPGGRRGPNGGPPPPPPPPPDGGPQGSGTDSGTGDMQPPPPPPDDQNGPPPGGPDGQQAQQSGSNGQTGPGPGGPGRHHRVPPIVAALDVNHDGIIDSSEINNAAQELETLDKNHTGKLTIPQLLGPPRGGRPPGPPPGQGGQGDDQNPPPPPPPQGGADSQPAPQ